MIPPKLKPDDVILIWTDQDGETWTEFTGRELAFRMNVPLSMVRPALLAQVKAGMLCHESGWTFQRLNYAGQQERERPARDERRQQQLEDLADAEQRHPLKWKAIR